MGVLNGIDRFHLVMDVCDMIENECNNVDETTRWTAAYVRQEMQQALVQHKKFIYEFGIDMEEIAEWKWDIKAQE
jgi:xylulose-5-phosphate/fructose-6-phosphate phosphoketolase